ncbi:MAG: hypothetical protein MUC65_08370 [Pontiellaceae bacterium]|jgi:hypothetical protein|nr:hypothetical protein [Pontiellaceae bacterium]
MPVIFLSAALPVSGPLRAAELSGKYPRTELSNSFVVMKLFLPDPVNGSYRATRFDWSGIISGLQYKGHEYFSAWQENTDPFCHEALTGPVEGYEKPGLGYAEARPGEGFIRIGIGILEKEDEKEYQCFKTYKIINHGVWAVEQGTDWIEFTHTLASSFGYAYVYTKRIELKNDEPGFKLIHTLKNTGRKHIETDQFNHNFFTIDDQPTGPDFTIRFPWICRTENNLNGLATLDQNTLRFLESLSGGKSIWMELNGYGRDAADHQVEVFNRKTGAGVRVRGEQPLHKAVFWARETTACPELYTWISVPPGQEQTWTSDYILFLNENESSLYQNN